MEIAEFYGDEILSDRRLNNDNIKYSRRQTEKKRKNDN